MEADIDREGQGVKQIHTETCSPLADWEHVSLNAKIIGDFASEEQR